MVTRITKTRKGNYTRVEIMNFTICRILDGLVILLSFGCLQSEFSFKYISKLCDKYMRK